MGNVHRDTKYYSTPIPTLGLKKTAEKKKKFKRRLDISDKNRERPGKAETTEETENCRFHMGRVLKREMQMNGLKEGRKIINNNKVGKPHRKSHSMTKP